MALTKEQTLRDCVASLRAKGYCAIVMWTAEDIQMLREDWTIEQCEDWLDSNESNIQDSLIEYGWELIEERLNYQE